MRDASCPHTSPLLAAINAESQVHLIIGANQLAAARCTKSLEVGAKPIIIAPETADVPYALAERIDDGSAQWLRRDFRDEDLTTLGREEVDHIVDMVFVTLGGAHPLSMSHLPVELCPCTNNRRPPYLAALSPTANPGQCD